jgi:hypothetical protein
VQLGNNNIISGHCGTDLCKILMWVGLELCMAELHALCQLFPCQFDFETSELRLAERDSAIRTHYTKNVAGAPGDIMRFVSLKHCNSDDFRLYPHLSTYVSSILLQLISTWYI